MFSKHQPRHRGSLNEPNDFAKMLASGWNGDEHVLEGGLGKLGHVHNPVVRKRAKRRSIVMVQREVEVANKGETLASGASQNIAPSSTVKE